VICEKTARFLQINTKLNISGKMSGKRAGGEEKLS